MVSRCPFYLLLLILLNSICCLVGDVSKLINVTFEPSTLFDLKDNEHRLVKVYYCHENTDQWEAVKFKSQDQSVAAVARPITLDNDGFQTSEESTCFNTTLQIEGRFIGKTRILAEIGNQSETEQSSVMKGEGLPVWVRRSDRTKTAIFVSTLGCLIILANILMGCQLNLDVVVAVLKKPIAPLIGFTCQFALMPVIAYSLAGLFLVPAGLYSQGLGLFTAGCSPGGGASNFWTILLGGNADLSITMTFISTIASLVMMPMWLSLLGRQFLVGHPEADIHIPYRNIVTSLLVLVIPLMIGVAIRKWRPACADKANKALRPFLLFIIVFILSFGAWANAYMFRLMEWRALTAGLLLPWCGFASGCFAALIARQPPPSVTAIAIETGIQNSGIAIMLLKVSFSQPDADMAAVAPVIVSMFTPLPLLLTAAIHHLLRRLRQHSLDDDDANVKKDTPPPAEHNAAHTAVVQHLLQPDEHCEDFKIEKVLSSNCTR